MYSSRTETNIKKKNDDDVMKICWFKNSYKTSKNTESLEQCPKLPAINLTYYWYKCIDIRNTKKIFV